MFKNPLADSAAHDDISRVAIPKYGKSPPEQKHQCCFNHHIRAFHLNTKSGLIKVNQSRSNGLSVTAATTQ